jgi:hypothetical protein
MRGLLVNHVIAIKDIKKEQVNINNVFIKFKLYKTIYIKPPLDIKIYKGFTLCLF